MQGSAGPTGRPRVRRTLVAAALGAVLVLVLTACLSSTPLEDLGGNLARAHAVNEHGVIVGSTLDGDYHRAFFRDPDAGVMTLIPSIAATGSGEALDVNDAGLVVGNSFSHLQDCFFPPTIPVQCPLAINHAFAYDSVTGELEDLADFGVGALPPGANEFRLGSTASGVNEAGIIVGTSTSIGPSSVPNVPFDVFSRPFAFDSVTDTLTDLSVYGITGPADINENGQVLAQIGGHAAVLDLATGATTEIGTFGGTFSRGHALNDTGLVVGEAQVAGNSAFHAFVYDMATGVMTDLGTIRTAGAPNSVAFGVNNDNIVVGTTAAPAGQHPFAYDVSAKSLKDLGALGSSIHAEARDINDAGLAVGFSHLPPTHIWQSTVTRHY
jgi:probable HAF family extracellular repeat protein